MPERTVMIAARSTFDPPARKKLFKKAKEIRERADRNTEIEVRIRYFDLLQEPAMQELFRFDKTTVPEFWYTPLWRIRKKIPGKDMAWPLWILFSFLDPMAGFGGARYDRREYFQCEDEVVIRGDDGAVKSFIEELQAAKLI